MPNAGSFQSALPRALSCMLIYLTASPLLSHAQNLKISTPETAAVPASAKDLLLSVDRMNSLKGADLKPWRIKVTYQATDEYGKHTMKEASKRFG
jgi:hypothetical protein